MDTNRIISLVVLAALLAGAAYTELTARKIPNWMTLTGAGAGLLLGYLPGGISLLESVMGLVVGFGFLLLFYFYGGMGGGDVKLMGAVGALLGYRLVLPAIVYTAFLGFLLAVFCLVSQRAFWIRSGRALKRLAGGARAADVPPPIQKGVPYGLAIAAGTMLVLFVAGK